MGWMCRPFIVWRRSAGKLAGSGALCSGEGCIGDHSSRGVDLYRFLEFDIVNPLGSLCKVCTIELSGS